MSIQCQSNVGPFPHPQSSLSAAGWCYRYVVDITHVAEMDDIDVLHHDMNESHARRWDVQR